MLATPGESGAFLRAPGREVRVTDGAGRVAVARGGVVASAGAGAGTSADAARPSRQLPSLSPLAALSTAPTPLSLPIAADVPLLEALDGCVLRATLHGQHLHINDARPLSSTLLNPHTLEPLGTLPPCGAEGAALLHAADASTGERLGGVRPCVVLLTRSPAIMNEVSATEAMLLEAEQADAASACDVRTRVQSALLAIGHALRPGCAPLLAARAAAAAIEFGWRAAAARVLAAHARHAAPELLLPRGVTLLHIAAQTGQEWAVKLVLAAGGEACVYGAPHSRCRTAAAATPLHVAAAAADAGAAVATALTARDAAAAVAWCTSPCGRGHTPSDVARACGAPALLSLDALLTARARAGTHARAAARDALQSENDVQTALGAALITQPSFAAAAAASAAGAAADARVVKSSMFRAAAARLGEEFVHIKGAFHAAVGATPRLHAPPPPPPLLLPRPLGLRDANADADAAFHAHEAASNVRAVLCFCGLVVVYTLTAHYKRVDIRVRGTFTRDQLAARGELSVDEMFRTMFWSTSWACQPAVVALAALLLAPARSPARAFYIRHHTCILSLFYASNFILNQMLIEMYYRHVLRLPPDACRWPAWNTQAHLVVTLTGALLPMRARPLCALMCVRAAMSYVGPACGCWPVGAPLDGPGGWATQGLLNSVVTAVACAVLLAHERRSMARWRAGRAAAASLAPARKKCD
jgi:hypothetical protein